MSQYYFCLLFLSPLVFAEGQSKMMSSFLDTNSWNNKIAIENTKVSLGYDGLNYILNECTRQWSTTDFPRERLMLEHARKIHVNYDIVSGIILEVINSDICDYQCFAVFLTGQDQAWILKSASHGNYDVGQIVMLKCIRKPPDYMKKYKNLIDDHVLSWNQVSSFIDNISNFEDVLSVNIPEVQDGNYIIMTRFNGDDISVRVAYSPEMIPNDVEQSKLSFNKMMSIVKEYVNSIMKSD